MYVSIRFLHCCRTDSRHWLWRCSRATTRLSPCFSKTTLAAKCAFRRFTLPLRRTTVRLQRSCYKYAVLSVLFVYIVSIEASPDISTSPVCKETEVALSLSATETLARDLDQCHPVHNFAVLFSRRHFNIIHTCK